MKLILQDKNILYKVSKNISNEKIKDKIYKMLKSARFENDLKIKGLEEIEIYTGFNTYLGNNTIEIFADNGFIELDIIDLEDEYYDIKEL